MATKQDVNVNIANFKFDKDGLISVYKKPEKGQGGSVEIGKGFTLRKD